MFWGVVWCRSRCDTCRPECTSPCLVVVWCDHHDVSSPLTCAGSVVPHFSGFLGAWAILWKRFRFILCCLPVTICKKSQVVQNTDFPFETTRTSCAAFRIRIRKLSSMPWTVGTVAIRAHSGDKDQNVVPVADLQWAQDNARGRKHASIIFHWAPKYCGAPWAGQGSTVD